eukprot:6368288-Amphidinium_carterae.1
MLADRLLWMPLQGQTQTQLCHVGLGIAAEACGVATSPLMEGRQLADFFQASDTVRSSHAHPQFAHRPIHIRQLPRDISWNEAQTCNDKEPVIIARIQKLHGLDRGFISQVLVHELCEMFQRSVQERDKERIGKWRSDMMTLRTACKYVRGAASCRPPAVVDVDGTLAVGYPKMDECLTRYWQSAAQPRSTTIAEVSTYVHARVEEWHQVPDLGIPPYTEDTQHGLRKRLRKNTALGPNGWRAREITQLP